MVVHLLSVAFTLFMLWVSAPGTDLFSWHPTCMTIGFVLLLLQAVVVFSPESSLFPTTPRPEKIQLHWILNSFGVASAAFGFGAVYLNKEVNSRKHFVSWHGCVGLATVLFACLAVLGGVSAKYSHTLRKWSKPINIKMYHATAGMIVFILAMTSIVLATYSNWYKNRVSGWVWRVSVWAPVILAVCVARQVTQSYLPRILTPRESELDAKAREIQEKVEAKLRKQKEKATTSNNKSSNSEQSEEDPAPAVDVMPLPIQVGGKDKAS